MTRDDSEIEEKLEKFNRGLNKTLLSLQNDANNPKSKLQARVTVRYDLT